MRRSTHARSCLGVTDLGVSPCVDHGAMPTLLGIFCRPPTQPGTGTAERMRIYVVYCNVAHLCVNGFSIGAPWVPNGAKGWD